MHAYTMWFLVQFLLGSRGAGSDVTSLSLFLDSLFQLERYHSCLQTAVQAALQLHQNYHLGNDLWTSSLRCVYRVVDKCLSSSEGLQDLKEKRDERLLRRLVVCALKAMDTVYEMMDSVYAYSMPITLPWKILFIIISK
jgi:hypothetical protein